MSQLFLLSGEHPDLAEKEIRSLIFTSKILVMGRILLADTNVSLSKRLAFTHLIGKHMFSCKINQLFDYINKYNFEKYYKKNYRVKIYHVRGTAKKDNSSSKKEENIKKITEKNIAEKIWVRLKRPNVNLNKPITTFVFIFQDNKVFCCKLISNIDKKILDRKSHLRPQTMPISLHPKLAQCMVNLTGIKNGLIVDPFCGTGGILIEAGLMGFSTFGYDIDKRMINSSKKNLDHFKIKNYNLFHMDSIKINRKMKYIVTDLPYGKNTKSIDINKLYKNFENLLEKKLTKRAVVGYPKGYRFCPKLKIISTFNYYIHKSMTKKIAIIET